MRTNVRLRPSLVGVFLAMVALSAVLVSPAQATTGHNFGGTFGIQGSSEDGGFTFGESPNAVAVDPSTSHVFATDPSHTSAGQPAPRIEEFDASGAFQAQFPLDPATDKGALAIGIDPAGAGSIYVDGGGSVRKYSLTGTIEYSLAPASGTTFAAITALAVDPSNGDVYVGAVVSSTGEPLVEIFDNTGTFQSSFDGSTGNDSPLSSVAALAIDGSSRVYVIDGAKHRVDRFSATGAYQTTIFDTTNSIRALAVDPSDEGIYVVTNDTQIEYFSEGGALHQDQMTVGTAIYGIAVDPGSATLYLADVGQAVGLIGTPFVGPTVQTVGSSATGVDQTLEGTLDPEGTSAEFHFEYGQDRNYGSETPSVPAGSGNTAEPVSELITGLLPNTTYHFRIVGTNPNGVIRGNDRTFVSAPTPPILDGSPPSASVIGPDRATVNGTLDPRGSATSWHFEYGETSAYGSESSPVSMPASQGAQLVTAELTGLEPATTYHYRLVADNGTGGPQTGQDATFTTAPAAPGEGISITGVSATLKGVVNPGEGVVKYHFEYGETTAYGLSTPERPRPEEGEFIVGNGDHEVEELVDRLKPGTTYHVRVVAKAPDFLGGTTFVGADGTFTTSPAPTAQTGAVTGITTEGASFSGTEDTHGLAGSYRFVVESPDSPFSASTPPVAIPAGTGMTNVSASIGGLQPGRTYTVRISVGASSVITPGNTVTFTTAGSPPGGPPGSPPISGDPYGCTNPILNAYGKAAHPGETIKVPGRDLGVGGTITLGGATVAPDDWSASSVSFEIPDDVRGSLPLSVNCGRESNTVALQVGKRSLFSIQKAKAVGTDASVIVRVTGPGDIAVKGEGLRTARRHVSKAGTYAVKADLNAAAKKSLRRNGTRAISLSVVFKPTGGNAATKTVEVTFKKEKR